jgi:hypothetical protein
MPDGSCGVSGPPVPTVFDADSPNLTSWRLTQPLRFHHHGRHNETGATGLPAVQIQTSQVRRPTARLRSVCRRRHRVYIRPVEKRSARKGSEGPRTHSFACELATDSISTLQFDAAGPARDKIAVLYINGNRFFAGLPPLRPCNGLHGPPTGTAILCHFPHGSPVHCTVEGGIFRENTAPGSSSNDRT